MNFFYKEIVPYVGTVDFKFYSSIEEIKRVICFEIEMEEVGSVWRKRFLRGRERGIGLKMEK